MDKTFRLVLIIAALFSGACSQLDPKFRSIGSSVLGATGYVTDSQANSFFTAGEKLGKAAEGLTDEQEYYLGRSVSAVILAQYRPLRNNAAQLYVNKVGKVLAGFSDKPETFSGYHFLILDTDEVNALSAPGGFIFISKGFLRLLPSEDALAAVLAHEVAHVVQGHGVKAIRSSNLTGALLLIGKEVAASQVDPSFQELTSLFGDSVNDITETLITKGYSRGQEYDSDEYAAQLLVRAGYNPAALGTVLRVLEQHDGGDAGGWASTHPDPDDRLDEVEDLIASNPEAARMESARTQRFQRSLPGLTAG
ncbi:MAG: M48 family metalloprotease [Deltaproteobacteria bacterium]|nr:M48 family metalloprotease [Deltaproteobacteria bacterium]